MHDKIADFVGKHRVLVFFLLGIILIFVILCIMRAVNMNKKKATVATNTQKAVATDTPEPTEFYDEESSYQSQLSIQAKEEEEKEKKAKARLDALNKQRKAEEERKRLEEARKNMKPTYGDEVICWDRDGVPAKMVDGSSCKNYFSSVKLSDFGSKWGNKLTEDDKFSTNFVMVGVDQNPKDVVDDRDNQSLGWLISNFNKLDKHTAIKFTDLNTIGSFTNSHVALLCSYDWYSAFGMQNTLVVFEDVSGKLKVKDFKEGVIFSAVVYKHNVKIKKVNGQTVVCVQYNKL